jgi:protocatechuate 3,4-dioxygenase alpha subunit
MKMNQEKLPVHTTDDNALLAFSSLTTPSQTVGPFFGYSLTAQQYGYDYSSLFNDKLIDDETIGERIMISGQVIDGQGNAINDAIVELYQSHNDNQVKMARLGTGPLPAHRFRFLTIKPPAQNGNVPFLSVIVFMRGSLHGLNTRIYFEDETDANQTDSVLNLIQADRKHTLIAKKSNYNGFVNYEFNIRIQGQGETVFFQV